MKHIRRWFFRVGHSSSPQRRAGEDLLRSLALIVETENLRASIATRIRELTGCDLVRLCTLRSDTDSYVEVCTSSPDSPTADISFAATGTLVNWLRTNQEPLVLPLHHDPFEYLAVAEQTILTTYGVRGCIPLISGVRLMAVLLICSERSDFRVSADDVDVLLRVGRQAGLALENAELHELERDRIKNLHRAQQLAVAGQLAATVAHEIRNPLTAIRSTVQYALQSHSDWESRRALLQETLEEVDRIERTVSGVLALSRTSHEDMTALDLITNVEQSLLVVRAYARSAGVSIDEQFEADQLLIRGNSRELHQVCVNLLMNACQAMPDGGRLTVRCASWQPSADSLPLALLQVRDTGHGISKENLGKVFNPFFTTKNSGTGLGLPICLEIVTRHGGNLRLESTEGRGTSATVLIPLRVA